MVVVPVVVVARTVQSFETFKETKRAGLRQKQAQEIAELEEKLVEKRFVLLRANELHRKTCVLLTSEYRL